MKRQTEGYLIRLVLVLILTFISTSAFSAESTAKSTGKTAAKVDLNSASEKDLVALPGVGEATAKKIIAGRPYKSIDDLSRAGVSKATITKISSLVTVGAASSASESTAKKSDETKAKNPVPEKAAQPGKVDINSASEKDLVALPGVGEATAKKIIGGRPFKSIDDLSRAGVSKTTIAKISSLVTVGGAAASSSPAPAAATPAAPVTSTEKKAKSTQSEATEEAPYQAPPSKGLVWVNLNTKIYHLEGDHWYGRTKNGKYMTEADAIKAGYTKAKKGGKPAASKESTSKP